MEFEIPSTMETLECKVCQDIWRLFSQPHGAKKVVLGSLSEAMSSRCPRHTPLVERFRVECGEEESKKWHDMGLIPQNGDSSVTMTESVTKLGCFMNLLLVKQDSTVDHVGTGRVMDPDWADLDLVKRWKTECITSHGARCENPLKIWRMRPTFLIDVEQKCIVSGQGCPAFVALSYRWGGGSGFKMDTKTSQALQQPHSLDGPEFLNLMPPIVRDAMYLTSVIGERYLWVDTHCIARVDDEDVAEQLNQMGAIYANAVVTIIAADGDSENGLPGLKGVSRPRDLRQTVIPFGQEAIIARNTGIFSMGTGTEYYKRGWTYQEYLMSPRRILFNRKELHWQCQCNVWHEETIFGTEVDKYIDRRLSVILAGFPDLGSLSHLISRYNERELRYDEDAHPGILGLLSVASRSFTGGFLYGLPEMLFDRALGWRPMWKHTNLRRRTPSDREKEDHFSASDLPSWSWVGWQGLLTMGYGEAARINHRQQQVSETIPITEWYSSTALSGAPWRRVRATWYENRAAFKDFTRPLPDGWSQHKLQPDELFRGEPYLFPDGCSDVVFKHRNMPDDDCESWHYPFPVKEISEFTPPLMPEQAPYISCKTKRARLWARQSGEENIMHLYSESCEQIGTLHLHHTEQRHQFPESGEDCLNSPGTPVELVAIHKSRDYSKTWIDSLQRYDHPLEVSEKYTVLWAEWKGEVAYRKAIGYVNKTDWEDANLEDITLILG